jgi:hypothetical protein
LASALGTAHRDQGKLPEMVAVDSCSQSPLESLPPMSSSRPPALRYGARPATASGSG